MVVEKEKNSDLFNSSQNSDPVKPTLMSKHIVKVKSVYKVTYNVLKIVTRKPENYIYTPGQATDIAVNRTGWQFEKRPFSITSLPEYDYLEFIIKTYPGRKGVTNQLMDLKKDDELILHDPFGTIAYKGQGVFIAGGAGITPFISIFRDLQNKNEIGKNKLIFANKTKADIILEQEFKKMLGNNFINILSEEKYNGYLQGEITEDFIKANCDEATKLFYLCGPPPMMEAIETQFSNMQVDPKSIIKEVL